jgi:hypothetical protein
MSSKNNAPKSRWLTAASVSLIGAALSGCSLLQEPSPAPVVELRTVQVDPVPPDLLVPVAKVNCLPKGAKKIPIPVLERAYSCKDQAESAVIAKNDALQRAVISREAAQRELQK